MKQKQHTKRFGMFSAMIFGLVVFLFTMGMGLAAMPLGTPKANTAVSDLVPFELVQKVALKKAQDRWGQVSSGPVLSACDENGDIVAYLFPFSIGTPSFPAYSEILASVQRGRKIAQEGLKATTAEDQQRLLAMKAKTGAAGSQSAVQKGKPGQTPSLTDADAKKLGREMMIGAGQYGTIVVSARYDRFPVPLYMHYLHPYFYQGDLAQQEAMGALKRESVTLERIYFLGMGHGQFFEFSANGETTLMNIYNLEVVPPEKALKRKGQRVIPEPGAIERTNEEWAKIKREVE